MDLVTEKPLRIAHLSDLHFSKLSFSPMQFFSKRWLGNLNLYLTRKDKHLIDPLLPLPSFLKEKGVDHVIITGDLTTTSSEKEFELAKNFIRELERASLNVAVLPGNHDQYTKRAFKQKIFYRYFPQECSEAQNNYLFNLKDHGIAFKPLQGKWGLLLLDTAIATSLISSRGFFSPQVEKNLEKALNEMPQEMHLILANHFPFFKHESPRKALVRSESLKQLVQNHPQIKLYLHGHTHQHILADLRASGFPIISDSGSTSHVKKGSFNLIELTSKACNIQVFRWMQTPDLAFSWILQNSHNFSWS